MKSVSSGFVLTSFCLAFCADVIFGGNCDEKVGGSEAPNVRKSETGLIRYFLFLVVGRRFP